MVGGGEGAVGVAEGDPGGEGGEEEAAEEEGAPGGKGESCDTYFRESWSGGGEDLEREKEPKSGVS